MSHFAWYVLPLCMAHGAAESRQVVQLVAFADRPTAAGAGAAPKSDGSTRALAAEEIIEEYVGDALGMDGGAGVSDATISSPLLSVSTAVRCALLLCFFPQNV